MSTIVGLARQSILEDASRNLTLSRLAQGIAPNLDSHASPFPTLVPSIGQDEARTNGPEREPNHSVVQQVHSKPRIQLNSTRSAALLALPPPTSHAHTGSTSVAHAPVGLGLVAAPPRKTALYDHDPLKGHAQLDPAAAAAAFFAPNGRSLRARTNKPSYLEIPPAPLEQHANPSLVPGAHPDKTAVELLRVSGKLVKRFKRWAKDRKGPPQPTEQQQEDSSSSLSDHSDSDLSDESDPTPLPAVPSAPIQVQRKRGRPKGSTKLKVHSNEPPAPKRPRGRPRKVVGPAIDLPPPSRTDRHESVSSLSSLSSDDDDLPRASPSKKRKLHDGDRDSSPLSSVDSSSSSSSPPSTHRTSRTPKILPFPHKPADHPLNRRVECAPSQPRKPPALEPFRRVQHDLNPYSWAEGLSAITLGGQVVLPTYPEDEQRARGQVADRPRKRPGWAWETLSMPLATVNHNAGRLMALVDPTPEHKPVDPFVSSVAPTFAPTPTPPIAVDDGAFISIPSPSRTSLLSLPNSSSAPPALAPMTIIPRPKTYRQIARLDWSDFHQRNKCRFTTSGAIEGVNPEGFAWEAWYGIEDEPVVGSRRFEAIDPTRGTPAFGLATMLSSSSTRTTVKSLVVQDRNALRNLSGLGRDLDLEQVESETPFAGGIEWHNTWRFKTLEEGMGRSWEWKCRWAVRNPERKYLPDPIPISLPGAAADSDAAAARPEQDKMSAKQRKQLIEARKRHERRREKKKAKRERERKEREGSGGESELTPFEGEELSPDSDSDSEDENDVDTPKSLVSGTTLHQPRQVVSKDESQSTRMTKQTTRGPYRLKSVEEYADVMRTEARGENAGEDQESSFSDGEGASEQQSLDGADGLRERSGTLTRCPVETCPQRLYHSKAASSDLSHHRAYHLSSLTLKYASGVSAFVERNSAGDFVCPTVGCGFSSKSRGTFAVHGKGRGRCEGPPESIPRPVNRPKTRPPEPPAPQFMTTSFKKKRLKGEVLSTPHVSDSDDE
ncbi:uncharacterized protein JCM15063_005287 [Sporobolomyces koalae]|uniref:uncharacterized protein n=1 Tax=Sporobolomyces koalae TaxID=500713 RepID=UPI00316E77B3